MADESWTWTANEEQKETDHCQEDIKQWDHEQPQVQNNYENQIDTLLTPILSPVLELLPKLSTESDTQLTVISISSPELLSSPTDLKSLLFKKISSAHVSSPCRHHQNQLKYCHITAAPPPCSILLVLVSIHYSSLWSYALRSISLTGITNKKAMLRQPIAHHWQWFHITAVNLWSSISSYCLTKTINTAPDSLSSCLHPKTFPITQDVPQRSLQTTAGLHSLL